MYKYEHALNALQEANGWTTIKDELIESLSYLRRLKYVVEGRGKRGEREYRLVDIQEVVMGVGEAKAYQTSDDMVAQFPNYEVQIPLREDQILNYNKPIESYMHAAKEEEQRLLRLYNMKHTITRALWATLFFFALYIISYLIYNA